MRWGQDVKEDGTGTTFTSMGGRMPRRWRELRARGLPPSPTGMCRALDLGSGREVENDPLEGSSRGKDGTVRFNQLTRCLPCKNGVQQLLADSVQDLSLLFMGQTSNPEANSTLRGEKGTRMLILLG